MMEFEIFFSDHFSVDSGFLLYRTFSRILAMLNRIRARPQKRNFDELDRSRFGAFYKRNFDQVDGAGFGTLSRYF